MRSTVRQTVWHGFWRLTHTSRPHGVKELFFGELAHSLSPGNTNVG